MIAIILVLSSVLFVSGFEKGSVIGKRCTYRFAFDEHEFTSPGYPEFYPSNATCIWKIFAKKDWHIRLTIIQLDLENSKHCMFDSVTIYDGEGETAFPFKKVCGSASPEVIRSISNVLTIVMNTDETQSGKGFKMQYKSVPGCSETYISSAGTIKSPGYPLFYPDGAYCTYHVLATVGKYIKLTFEDFSLEEEQYYECYDHVSIFTVSSMHEEKLLGKYCGQKIEKKTFCIKDSSASVRFVSDDAVNFRGFKMKFQVTDEPCVTDEPDEAEEHKNVIMMQEIELFNAMLDQELKKIVETSPVTDNYLNETPISSPFPVSISSSLLFQSTKIFKVSSNKRLCHVSSKLVVFSTLAQSRLSSVCSLKDLIASKASKLSVMLESTMIPQDTMVKESRKSGFKDGKTLTSHIKPSTALSHSKFGALNIESNNKATATLNTRNHLSANTSSFIEENRSFILKRVKSPLDRKLRNTSDISASVGNIKTTTPNQVSTTKPIQVSTSAPMQGSTITSTRSMHICQSKSERSMLSDVKAEQKTPESSVLRSSSVSSEQMSLEGSVSPEHMSLEGSVSPEHMSLEGSVSPEHMSLEGLYEKEMTETNSSKISETIKIRPSSMTRRSSSFTSTDTLRQTHRSSSIIHRLSTKTLLSTSVPGLEAPLNHTPQPLHSAAKNGSGKECRFYLSIQIVDGGVPLVALTSQEDLRLRQILESQITSVWEVGWPHAETLRQTKPMHYGTLVRTSSDGWLLYVRGRLRKHLHLLQLTEKELNANQVRNVKQMNSTSTKSISTIRDFLSNIPASVRMQIKFC